ncbi:MAG: arylsulfotransferase family protein [Solirubrobacteraceae bacterium]
MRVSVGGSRGRGLVRVLMAAVGVSAALGAAASTVGASYTPPTCRTLSYHSAPGIYAQRVCMNLGVSTHATRPGTYLFLTPRDTGEGIYTDTGVLVWWKPRSANSTEDHDLSVVQLWGHPYLAVWSGHTDSVKTSNDFFINDGTVLLYNQRYQQVGAITAGGAFAGDRIDMHEFRITPEGDALVGIYQPVHKRIHGHREYVVQYVIQKLSLVKDSSGIHTGRVLFHWNTAKHIPLSASYLPDPGAGSAWDYFHGNAIAEDTDGNLIVSARNTWTIYKINVKTGRIMWRVGGKGEDQLRTPWCYQHDVSPLGHNDYSVFDDGAAGPGCFLGLSGHPARGLIFHVNPSTHPAKVRLVRAYKHKPGITPGFLGSTQQLPNGHVVVGWGNFPEITEFSADGTRVLMDLSMSNYSFRGYRFAWDGRPTAPPALAARLESNGTRLWASWNGSTEVAGWRVLVGTTTAGLTSAGAVIKKTGFETAIFLKQREPLVEVQALDASGHILATSKPVSTMSTGG